MNYRRFAPAFYHLTARAAPPGSRLVFAVGGARLVTASRLGRCRLLLATGLLLDARGVFGLGVLNPRRLLALGGVLVYRAAGGPVLGAGLLLPGLRRGAALHLSALRWHTFFSGIFGGLRALYYVARWLWKVRVALAREAFEHRPHHRGRQLQMQGQVLGAGQDLVVVCAPFVAEGLERPGDVLRGDEGVSAGDHAQVLDKGQVEATHHPHDRFGLEDAPPDKETGVVTVGPPPQNLALVDVVVLGNPVLELPQKPARQNA